MGDSHVGEHPRDNAVPGSGNDISTDRSFWTDEWRLQGVKPPFECPSAQQHERPEVADYGPT
jgi:hypothetical protein